MDKDRLAPPSTSAPRPKAGLDQDGFTCPRCRSIGALRPPRPNLAYDPSDPDSDPYLAEGLAGTYQLAYEPCGYQIPVYWTRWLSPPTPTGFTSWVLADDRKTLPIVPLPGAEDTAAAAGAALVR
jgi:hypothetical protein